MVNQWQTDKQTWPGNKRMWDAPGWNYIQCNLVWVASNCIVTWVDLLWALITWCPCEVHCCSFLSSCGSVSPLFVVLIGVRPFWDWSSFYWKLMYVCLFWFKFWIRKDLYWKKSPSWGKIGPIKGKVYSMFQPGVGPVCWWFLPSKQSVAPVDRQEGGSRETKIGGWSSKITGGFTSVHTNRGR